MAMFNKSDWWEDRKGHAGKGDLHKDGQTGYRNSAFWGLSGCCNAPVLKTNGKEICEKCNKETKKVKTLNCPQCETKIKFTDDAADCPKCGTFICVKL